MWSDVELMRTALEEAEAADAHGDVPIGAVVCLGDEIIGRSHNARELQQDPTAHAEILALREAALHLGSWRLTGCTLVVTLEPCAMCAGAMVNARVSRVLFGATDPKAGACGSLYNLCSDPRLNHEVAITQGVLADECGMALTSFFSRRR